MINRDITKVTVQNQDYGMGDPGYHTKYIVDGEVVARGPHTSGRWAYSGGWSEGDRAEVETWTRGEIKKVGPNRRTTEQVLTRPPACAVAEALDEMTDTARAESIEMWEGWAGGSIWQAYFVLDRDAAAEYRDFGWSPSMASSACTFGYRAELGPTEDIEMMRKHALSKHSVELVSRPSQPDA